MEHLASYRAELQIIGYSGNGIYGRLQAIKNCILFLNKTVKDITPADIRNYFMHLKLKGMHANTIQHYHHDIEQYFVWLEREKHIKENPFNRYELQLKKQQANQRHTLSQQEIKQLYAAARTGKEKMILHLCYGCGLRAEELQRMNISDINTGNQTITVQKGKNSKRRVIPLNSTLTTDIQQYLEERKRMTAQNPEALLLNEKGARLKQYTARSILHQMIQRTGIHKVITLHCLRHSIATHLLENGVSVEKVSIFLGHKQLESTEIYTRVSKQQLKQIQSFKPP